MGDIIFQTGFETVIIANFHLLCTISSEWNFITFIKMKFEKMFKIVNYSCHLRFFFYKRLHLRKVKDLLNQKTAEKVLHLLCL